MTATAPTLIVEAELATGTTSGALVLNDATFGKLDTGGTLLADTWVDISTYVERVEIRRGSQRANTPTVRYDAGSATVTLINLDGRFDPTNLSGPYVAGGITQLRPMKGIRIKAVYGGVTYPLIKVYANEWAVDYGRNGRSTIVTGSDAIKVLSNYNGPQQTAVGAGETSGARINRVLDNAGWPAADRLVQTGNSTMQATTLAQPAWSEILLTSDSEGGQVYVNGAGQVQFQQRQDVFTNPRATTIQATFGDSGDATEIPYTDVAISYDDTQLANYVRIARVGGVEQTAQDGVSQAAYLTRTFTRSDLIVQTDAEAANYAGQLLYQWKDPELRFESVTVQPKRVGTIDAFPYLLGAAFGDRVRVRRRPANRAGALIEQQVFVRGLTHVITNRDWTTTLSLQSATKWGFFTLNDTVLGVLDTDALTY